MLSVRIFRLFVGIYFICMSNLLFASNRTPSCDIARIISPSYYEADLGVDTAFKELYDSVGQHYNTITVFQIEHPGITPDSFLLHHIRSVDGTLNTGILLHAGHGSVLPFLEMDNFNYFDSLAVKSAANARLVAYEAMGFDTNYQDQIEVKTWRKSPFDYVIVMFPDAIYNRGFGLEIDSPLVYMATCYGYEMLPSYMAWGACAGLGPTTSIDSPDNRYYVKTFLKG